MGPDRAAELIARLSDQCSQSLSQFQTWGQTIRGDFKGLGPPDIAAALAGAPGASGLVVRIKYAGQYRYADDLLAALVRSEEHTSELQSLAYLVCRPLLEKKKRKFNIHIITHIDTALGCLGV